MQEHSTITCLKCANTAAVPDGGVNDLPNNYFIDSLINKHILNYKLDNEKELRCEECDEDDPAVAYCTDCRLFLCCYCRESHKYSKSHCSHNLISLIEMRSNKDFIQSKSEFPTCQEHDLELEYYCESCEKLVCVQCTGEHEDHKYDVVKKVADKYHNDLKEMTAPIEVIIEDLSKLYDSSEGVKTAIRQQGDKIEENIDLWYDEVIQNLLKQKEEIKQKVRNTVSQKEEAIKVQLKEVKRTQEDILNIKRMRNSIDESCDQEVLSAKYLLFCSLKRLTENCKKLGTGPIESANITVTPVNEPLPQIVEHYATIDSLSFVAKKFNSFAQRGQIVTLEVITKDSKGDCYFIGGCKVSAVVATTRTGEKCTAQVMDNNNGCYVIYFLAEQFGEM